jgi:hypothetical protein
LEALYRSAEAGVPSAEAAVASLRAISIHYRKRRGNVNNSERPVVVKFERGRSSVPLDRSGQQP